MRDSVKVGTGDLDYLEERKIKVVYFSSRTKNLDVLNTVSPKRIG